MDFRSEEEEVFTAAPSVCDKQGNVCQADMGLPGAADKDGLQHGESKLLYLTWKQSGIDTSSFFSGEKEDCPLDYAPLARWDPSVSKEMLAPIGEEDEIVVTTVEHSKWVSMMMNFFL